MQIRDLAEADGDAIRALIKDAFSGFPWHEDLSLPQVESRWSLSVARVGFGCLVATSHQNDVYGAIWWDTPNLEELSAERGVDLATFAASYVLSGSLLVWERDVLVFQEHQGLGIGKRLRMAFLNKLSEGRSKILLLTRMRDDNIPILRIAERLGFIPTGLKKASTAKPDVQHQYWYKQIAL